MILDSKNIKYEIIDITEPGKEEDKEFMQSNSTNKGSTCSDPGEIFGIPLALISKTNPHLGSDFQSQISAQLK